MTDKHESIDGLDRMIAQELRKDALSWWRSMGVGQAQSELEKWRLITNDSRKSWNMYMISNSDSAIERIYRELVLEENFD